MKTFYQKGITIIELVIVLAVIGIIILIVSPQFSRIRENQVLKSATQDIFSMLDKAHSQTLASLNSSEYGVHFQSDKVILFKGKIYSIGVPENEIINIISPATISNISLTGGAVDVYFNRLSGTPNVSGSVIVSSTNFSKTITISITGTIGLN